MERSNARPHLDPATWVDLHGDYLYRFALARVRNQEVAEDMVQEALLAGLTARHSFRGQSSERSWLTAILKRKVIDWLRADVRKRARQEPLPDTWADALFTRRGLWKAAPNEWSLDNPGSSMTRDEFWETLAGCLNKLPARAQQAFVLWHIDQHATEEVCKTLGASTANLWVMLHRARLRMWRCLSVNWFREDPQTPSAEVPL